MRPLNGQDVDKTIANGSVPSFTFLSSLGVVVVLSLLAGCTTGSRHTSDTVLARRFKERRSDFDTLLATVQNSSGIEMVAAEVVYVAGRSYKLPPDRELLRSAGISDELLISIRHLMTTLGIKVVIRASGRVEFRVDPGSVLNGDSYKGYMFLEDPSPVKVRPNLDDYRWTRQDQNPSGDIIVYKKLDERWFLYLFINA